MNYDEFTMKPILDENGRMILREECYIDGINCIASQSKNLEDFKNDPMEKYISEKCKEPRKSVKATKNINQQIHYTGQYLSNKPVLAQMLKSRNKKNFHP